MMVFVVNGTASLDMNFKLGARKHATTRSLVQKGELELTPGESPFAWTHGLVKSPRAHYVMYVWVQVGMWQPHKSGKVFSSIHDSPEVGRHQAGDMRPTCLSPTTLV